MPFLSFLGIRPGMKREGLLSLRRIEAVLFDMDGVLVDSMNGHSEAWKELLLAQGIVVSDRFIFENEGAMGPEILISLFQAHGRPYHSETIREIYYKQNEKFVTEYLPKVNLFPETPSLLQMLREKGIILGLVTGSRRNIIEKIWRPEELSWFATVVSADDTDRFKPHPDPYLKALQDIGLPGERCLVVENAPAGIQAALSAGLTCFAITSTLPKETLAMAHRIFPNLKALKEFLSQQSI